MATFRTGDDSQTLAAWTDAEIETCEIVQGTAWSRRGCREEPVQQGAPVHDVPRSQTSTHTASTRSANLAGAMRSAELVEPAAGRTSVKAFNEMSQ